MTTSSRPPGSGRSGALRPSLLEMQRAAASASNALLQHVPDTGDHVTGRAVDDFVDSASDALRALAESVADTLGHVEASGVAEADHSTGPLPWPEQETMPGKGVW